MAAFHPLTVTGVRRETLESVVLTLAPPPAARDAFRFVQGQYLTLRTTLDGEEVRRSYSICAAAHEPELRVGIKKIQGGLFSTWANEEVVPGQVIEAMPPLGNFHLPLDPATHRYYVGFAAGSGITPLISILKTTLAAEPHSRFTLVYGNRVTSSIMFREDLEDLKNENLGRLALVHILSREQQDIELFNGRIDKAKCGQLLDHWLDIAGVDAAFICGPQDMMLQVSESLREHGLDQRRIKFELFATAEPGKRARKAAAESVSRTETCQATITIDGRSRELEIAKQGPTVLDAALEAGMELPFACKAGVCSTCRAMLTEGKVDMDANYALEDYEIVHGYILTCQSYPTSDRLVVDFDQ
ncbi:MAG: 1,2-phenylacetyl-CoA epoxidase subunit PaaE [Geminicoccaceae bacterium]